MNFVQEHLAGRVDLLQFYRDEGVAFQGKRALCPFHEDTRPSFDVVAATGVFICRSCGAGGDPVTFLEKRRGLDTAAAITELRERYQVAADNGRPPAAPAERVWLIRDAEGNVVAEHRRRDDLRGGKKKFRWMREGRDGLGGLPSASLPLYGSERVKNWPTEDPIIVVEGEKAADALLSRDLHALGTVTGASSAPTVEALELLRDHHVVLWGDHDEIGRRHRDTIADRLDGIASSIRILEWGEQPGDDSHDFFARGGTEEQLDRLLADAPSWHGQVFPVGDDTGPKRNPRLVVTWDEFMAEQAPCLPSLVGDGLLVRGGGYLLVGGDTGVGKTILIANLCIALGAGLDSFLGFKLPGVPVTSLFLEAEGNRWIFRDRMKGMAEAMGVTGSLPIFFHERNTELAVEGPSLETMIAETNAELVFMDTIGRFWVGSENDATEWRAGVTVPLAKLSSAHNVAFSFGDHYNKPNENRSGQHKIRGTPAKVQDCGAAMRLEVGKGGDRSRILFFDRVRDGGLPEPAARALTIDVRVGTVNLDETPGALDNLATPEVRIANVVGLVAEISGKLGDASTAQLLARLQDEFKFGKSQAEALITSAVEVRKIERCGRGRYRLPGGLTQ